MKVKELSSEEPNPSEFETILKNYSVSLIKTFISIFTFKQLLIPLIIKKKLFLILINFELIEINYKLFYKPIIPTGPRGRDRQI